MDKHELQRRTKEFSLRVINLIAALPNTAAARVSATQLMKSGSSVGANYRATCRARSHAEFVAKIGVVEEEADECAFWMELIMEANLLKKTRVGPLLQEANELTAIMAASRISAQRSPRNKSAIGNRKSAIGNQP